MTSIEREQLILELLKKETTIKELKRLTKLNTVALTLKLNSLRNQGYNIVQKCRNEELRYKMSQEKSEEYPVFRQCIPSSKTRFLVISDTHVGAVGENIDILNRLYDYALTNRISQILHVGDLIQGPNLFLQKNDRNLLYQKSIEQICHFIAEYPYSDEIYNCFIQGNHDFRSIDSECFDISKLLTAKRLDFVYMGISFGALKIFNDFIIMHHPTCMNKNKHNSEVFAKYPEATYSSKLILRGHLHESGYKQLENGIVLVKVPTLYKDTKPASIGAWDIRLEFANKGIGDIILTPLYTGEQIYPVTEIWAKTRKR